MFVETVETEQFCRNWLKLNKFAEQSLMLV